MKFIIENSKGRLNSMKFNNLHEAERFMVGNHFSRKDGLVALIHTELRVHSITMKNGLFHF